MITECPAIQNLDAVLHSFAAAPIGAQGFPYLAETLRRAGVRTTTWSLPAMLCHYDTALGPVVVQEAPLMRGMAEVPCFDRGALIEALRADQTGETSFTQFADAAWRAGVVRWVVTLDERRCTYFGLGDQTYVEDYPAVDIGVRPLR